MALPANHLSFLFLLVLIFSTQARESKFFSKFNHYQQLNTTINGTANIATTTTTTTGNGNTMNSTTANTSTTTTPSSESLKETELPQEQVPSGKQVEEENSHGYGLYGSNQNPPTTAKTSQEYTYTNTPNKASTEEYTGGGYEEESTTGYENDNKNNYGYKPKQFGMSDTRFMDNANVYNNNNGYNNNQYETSFQENGSNGAKTKQLGMSDTSFLDNNDINNNKDFGDKQYSSSYTGVQENDNNGFETKEFGPSDSKFLDNGNINNDNGYETKQYETSANKNGDNLSGVKQQGVSDTRFMENGKYFYNVNNENSYLNNYQPESRSYDGFSSSQRVDARNNNNHDNNENAYEFNNSMGESQYQDEENQEEFLP